ncbi:MAG TPA: sugar transferase [Solirubrobacteraceae bacterium]|nr:sugar transferase [Solirubrobacteraceae bacterium]
MGHTSTRPQPVSADVSADLALPPERQSPFALASKRGLDLALAGLGLLILCPLMAVIAIAIRLESKGAVLFRQTRVGRHGRRFAMYKFRTMVAGSEEQQPALSPLSSHRGLFTLEDDPRLTWVGRLLRRSSLDELPQLINVLRNEMSLVGPRPLVPEEDATILGEDRRRLDLKPGMTGEWQILRHPRVPLAEMVQMDHRYLQRRSLRLDLAILARTVPYVLSGRGR